MTADEHEWKGKTAMVRHGVQGSMGIYQGMVQRWCRYLFLLLLLFWCRTCFVLFPLPFPTFRRPPLRWPCLVLGRSLTGNGLRGDTRDSLHTYQSGLTFTACL